MRLLHWLPSFLVTAETDSIPLLVTPGIFVEPMRKCGVAPLEGLSAMLVAHFSFSVYCIEFIGCSAQFT